MYQDRYWHARTFHALDQLKVIANELGRPLLELAFAWLLHHTQTDVVILGASSISQLKQNLEACASGPIPTEFLTKVDDVWRELRGPVPYYNR